MLTSVAEEVLSGLLNSLRRIQAPSFNLGPQRFNSLRALLFGLASAVGADVAFGCFGCLREVYFVWAARSIHRLSNAVTV